MKARNGFTVVAFGRALAVAAMALGIGHVQGQAPTGCPAAVPAGTSCYSGQDPNGAFYLIAIPATWNGMLVVHAHGGPDLGPPTPARAVEDLTRWSITVKEGFAWAGSTYRRGGYGTRMAAEDTDNLRKIFLDRFTAPTRTFVHGQSWGGNVAAKVIEVYNSGPVKHYDGALLTSGVLGGGTRGYLFRADLRVVYQYYCQNHPRPAEPQYPLWMGLPLESTMTAAELRARVNECTGYALPAAQRTPQQQQNLANILNVVRIPERTFASHMNFATFTFRDMVMLRLEGLNPFSNWDVHFEGSTDDKALNKGVERYKAETEALEALGYDSDLTGQVSVPVITVHAIDDPTAFIEHESAYRETLEHAKADRHLLQLYTNESEHSFLQQSEYAAAFQALVAWVATGVKPPMQTVVANCEAARIRYNDACLFDTTYQPNPFFARTYPRAPRDPFPTKYAE
jgi:hypothetical protein